VHCSARETVAVYFSDQDVVIEAEPAEPLLKVFYPFMAHWTHIQSPNRT
jgi:hypothetical protein